MSLEFTTVAASLLESITPGKGSVPGMYESDEVIYSELSKRAKDVLDKNYQPYKTGDVIKKYQSEYKKNDAEIADALNIGYYTEQDKRIIRDLKNSRKFIPREWAIKLAFLFGLNMEKTNAFLNELRKPILHVRDYREMIYAFMLDEQRSYSEAIALISEYANIYDKVQPVDYEKVAEEKADLKKEGASAVKNYTVSVLKKIKDIDHIDYTYDKKKRMLMDILESDDMKRISSELNYTASKYYRKHVDAVCDYLSYDWVRRRSREAKYHLKMYRETLPNIFGESIMDNDKVDSLPKLNEIQNKILDEHKIDGDVDKFLREADELGRMYNVQRGVPRMNYLVAILLYVSNVKWDEWEADYKEEYWEMEMEEFRFNQCIEYTNFALRECGYPLLNPRCYFDYLVLLSYTTLQPHETFDKLFFSVGI